MYQQINQGFQLLLTSAVRVSDNPAFRRHLPLRKYAYSPFNRLKTNLTVPLIDLKLI